MLFVILHGNYEDINDVSQNILMSLYLSLKQFKFKSSFKTYLYRFIKNKAIDFIRKQTGLKKVVVKIRQENHKTQIDPELEYLRKEVKSDLYYFLFKLNEEDRILIYLKDIEGKSITEIAEIMKKKSGTVKSGIHRARNKLFKIIQEADYEYV